MNSISSLTKLIQGLVHKATENLLTSADLEALITETLNTENAILSTSLSYPYPWQSSQYLHIQLERIVDLDNELFAATEDKQAVLPYCHLMHRLNEHLLRNTNHSANEVAPLSHSYRIMTADQLTNRWAVIRRGLEEQGCSITLLDLCEKPLHLLSAMHVRYRQHDHRYLEQYLDKLEKVTGVSETPLIEALIRLDMNSSRVFTYIANKLNATYAQLGTPEEQLQWLDEQERYFGQFGLVSSLSYRPEGNKLLDELKGWVEDRLALAWTRSPADEDEWEDEAGLAANNQTIKRNMNVTELAVFEKMLYDLGLTTERNLETLSIKLSKNFSSRERNHLQAHSILKKFNVRDNLIKNTLQGWLRDMGDWLRRNMN
ncbi:hypothetical protein SAMN05216436_11096 [bacterium A37T11]|nr:hypothetical protein SAMN05216436_11096 [bacterium A37T11]